MSAPNLDWIFLEPVDVLCLRGNRLFGAAGAYGEALMPPWPSLVSGALRSQMLAEHAADLAAFRDGGALGPAAPVLGSYAQPGSFRLAALLGGRRQGDLVEPLLPLPADMIADRGTARYLRPYPLEGIQTGALLSALPIAAGPAAKPQAGQWLTCAGIEDWLAGRVPGAGTLVAAQELWQIDSRVGIARDAAAGTVREGALFSTDAIAPKQTWAGGNGPKSSFGFLAGAAGAAGMLPVGGVVRLGGDGRAARVFSAAPPPQPDVEAIARARRFRLLLITPGLFAGGWRLPGLADDYGWAFAGARARLCAAAVPRAQTISGWDLAQGRPKPALRAAPSGSVYWLDRFEGTAGDLRHLLAHGVPFDLSATESAQRRAEGFNNVWLGAWPEDPHV